VAGAVLVFLLAALAAPARAQDPGYSIALTGAPTLFSRDPRPVISGTTTAPPGSVVTVTVGERSETVAVAADGSFRVVWPVELAGGSYPVRARLGLPPAGREGGGPGAEPGGPAAEATLVVQPESRIPFRPLIAPPPEPPEPRPEPNADDFQAYTDRWRIVPPPTALTEESRGRLDPYHQNVWKGDRPIRSFGERGERELFLVLTGISDTLAEYDGIPIPAGVSTDRPGTIEFFGREGLVLGNQNLFVSADLFEGATAFRPAAWRARATVAANLNHAAVGENAVVRPDVRDGTSRTTGFGALQELFVEKQLADLSPSYDFVSVRAGIQPFTSDFRGFVFSDTNLGLRLFGNYASNRWQYNLVWMERLEKETNSGLNRLEWRDQRVAVANLYRQDFPVLGLTSQVSVHYLRDEATFKFDRNGFLVRPDPAGSFTPHEVEAVYLGAAAFGHLGRVNVDGALYFVTGEDSLNPIAGPGRLPGVRDEVDVEAGMAALELSYDRDWLRPKLGLFYATGDDDPTDRDARGFDAIFDNPAFAGGGFSYWNRLGIRLGGTAVTLVNRGSLLPSLKSSKEEGQPNFVNPGLLLATGGADLEVAPRLRAVATANYLRFATTETLELLLFQGEVDEEIGWDLSLGARWRPFLNENAVVLAGAAAFLPGRGFRDIYEDGSILFAAFTNLVLTY
jgi:hypothetical protein